MDWNRNYDTSLGRYIEVDPLGIDAGQNVYGYVDGNLMRTYDANYWLSQTQVTALGVTRLGLSFGRNANGDLTSVRDNASSGRGASFGYAARVG